MPTRWNAERQAVEFGIEIGEYQGVVRVPQRGHSVLELVLGVARTGQSRRDRGSHEQPEVGVLPAKLMGLLDTNLNFFVANRYHPLHTHDR
jgi:hypothetical protein